MTPTFVTSDEIKLRCYKLLVQIQAKTLEIIFAERALDELRGKLKAETAKILEAAGPEFELTDDFDTRRK